MSLSLLFIATLTLEPGAEARLAAALNQPGVVELVAALPLDVGAVAHDGALRRRIERIRRERGPLRIEPFVSDAIRIRWSDPSGRVDRVWVVHRSARGEAILTSTPLGPRTFEVPLPVDGALEVRAAATSVSPEALITLPIRRPTGRTPAGPVALGADALGSAPEAAPAAETAFAPWPKWVWITAGTVAVGFVGLGVWQETR